MLGTGTPPEMACSCTGMNGSWSSAPDGAVGFQLLKNCEAAASSSSLFVTGAVYEACRMWSRPSWLIVDSGDHVPNPYTATQSSPRTRHPSPSALYVLAAQTNCLSKEALTLFRCESCAVMRPARLLRLLDVRDVMLRSAT